MANSFESQQESAWVQFAYAVQAKGSSFVLDRVASIEFFLSELSGIKGVVLDNYRLELLKDLERFEREFGISYADIYSSLSAWNYYATTYLRREFLDQPAFNVFFGFNRDPSVLSGYTDSRFLDDVRKAGELLRVVEDAAREQLPPPKVEQKKEEEAEEQKEPEKEEEEGKEEEEKKKPEEPKKEEAKEESPESAEGGENNEDKDKEQAPVVPNASALKVKKSLEELKSVDEGDRQFRQEIVRMQQLSLRQMAQAFGVPEGQQAQFVQALAADLTPFITHEMLSLSNGDLANALKSSSTRYDVYLKVMLRAQQSPQFQVALQKAAKKFVSEGKKLSSKEIEDVSKATRVKEEVESVFADLEQRGLVEESKEVVSGVTTSTTASLSDAQRNLLQKIASITPEVLVQRIKNEEAGYGLGEVAVQRITEVTRMPTSVFESELRTVLADGAGLTESQIRGIFTRLQSYAITRSNIEHISPDDFERVFGEGLGGERELILERVQKAFSGSGVSWGRVLSSYVRSAKVDIVAKTGNSAALFTDSTREPTKTLIDQAQKEVFSRGFDAVSLGIYASRDALEKQLQQIQAGEQVESIARLSGKSASSSGTMVLPSFLVASSLGAKPNSEKDLQSALDLKAEGSQKLLGFMRENPGLMSRFAENGFSAETYDEIHWAEKVEYLRTVFLQKDMTAEELQVALVQFYVEEPVFLYEIGYEEQDPEGDWYFYSPSGEPAIEYADYAPDLVAGAGVELPEGPAVQKYGGRIRKRANKSASVMQKATESAKRKRLQAALTLALTVIPGGAALLPLLKAGFASVDALRSIPGGEKILKFFGNLSDPDQVKRMVIRAMLGAAALQAALLGALLYALSAFWTAVSGILAIAGKVAAILAAGAAGFLIGGPLGALLAGGAATMYLFGGEISAGLAPLLSSVGAGAASAWAATTGALSSAWASAIAGTKAFFGGLMGVTGGLSMVTGPIVGATMTVATAGIALNQDVIRAAFLTERTAISYGAPAPRGLQVAGCWPTSGRITGIEEYCGGGKHATMGNSTAVDISAVMGSPVYAPFSGTATFYRNGSGLSPGYGNHVVLRADNGVKLIFGHLLDFANFQSFEGGSAEVSTGDVIGRVDNTGNSDGNHLHYEVWGGTFRDVVPDPDIGCGAQVVSSCSPDSVGR